MVHFIAGLHYIRASQRRVRSCALIWTNASGTERNTLTRIHQHNGWSMFRRSRKSTIVVFACALLCSPAEISLLCFANLHNLVKAQTCTFQLFKHQSAMQWRSNVQPRSVWYMAEEAEEREGGRGGTNLLFSRDGKLDICDFLIRWKDTDSVFYHAMLVSEQQRYQMF